MRRLGKDTAEVATFRGLYAQLQSWVDDLPGEVVTTAARDESVDDLCRRLHNAAEALRRAERSRPELFIGPADPAFIKDWRDYEARYDAVVTYVALRWLSDLLDLPDEEPRQSPNAGRQWREADNVAEEAARGLEYALGFAQEQISQAYRFDEDLVDEIEEGLREWEGLKQSVGFDLRGVIRRRRLVPFTLVPRHVAARYSESDRISLLASMRAAHDAFVFGASLAVLAMMRAILEAVLRDHYPPRGVDLNLEERINRAQGLPTGAPRGALHRIRKLGNVVMHSGEGVGLPDPDPAETEKTIASLLLVLRTLIEEAPARS